MVGLVHAGVLTSLSHVGDKKGWRLTGNGTFSVKSFYKRLIDGASYARCRVSFGAIGIQKKISLFNWLAWHNKILSLENLAHRRCNRLPTDTCVLCHAGSESVDHLFIQCDLAQQVWEHFARLLHFPQLLTFLVDLWGRWRTLLHPERRAFGDLVAKAIVWTVWIARNDCIFNAITMHVYHLIVKIGRMLVSWCSSFSGGSKAKLEDDISTVRCSLEFLGPWVKDLEATRSSKETLVPSAG